MKCFPKNSALVLAATLGVVGSAGAVDPMPVNQNGPFEFIPTLKVSQGYDDNVDASEDGEERSSNVTKVAPTFLLRAQERANRYQLRYTPTFQRYSHDSDDNRVNHTGSASSRLVFDARNRANFSLTGQRSQSTPDNEPGSPDEGDINERLSLNGTYGFGARGAKGQIEIDGGYTWNRYANNLGENSSNNQSQEYNNPRIGATFLWRVAPRTQLLAEGRYADFDYTQSDSDLDSTNMLARVGARWQATGKTSGSLRVGRQEKDFDNANKDRDATNWQAQISWQPVTQSRVSLSTSNSIAEGSDSEDAVEQTLYSLSWNHDWNGRVSSNVGYQLRDKDYIGGDDNGRDDELSTISVGLSYSFRRWFDVGLETRFQENDSSEDLESYDRNTYFLTATLSL